jgi:hypothetical protein
MLPVSRLWKASVRIAGVKAEIWTQHKFSCVTFRPTCSVGVLTTHGVFCATSIRWLSHSINKEQFRCYEKKMAYQYVSYKCVHTHTQTHICMHTGQDTYFGSYKIILKLLCYARRHSYG